MNSRFSFIVKLSIIFIGICGLAMCCFWYPFLLALSAMSFALPMQNVVFITQLLFYIAVSVPCFVILGIGWKIAGAIKRETVFTRRTARMLRKCATILTVDEIVFIVGNIILCILGWNKGIVAALFMIGTIGIVVVIALSILSRYVSEAAELREVAEGTI